MGNLLEKYDMTLKMKNPPWRNSSRIALQKLPITYNMQFLPTSIAFTIVLICSQPWRGHLYSHLLHAPPQLIKTLFVSNIPIPLLMPPSARFFKHPKVLYNLNTEK